MKKILALAAHPDDIEIGCGGTLAVHAARGDEVHTFVATYGEAGGDAVVRKREQETSAKILGIEHLHWGGYGDTTLPQQAMELMKTMEALVAEVKPDVVYVNHRDDTHQDHRVMAQVANSVTRYTPNVLAFETPSTLGFEPSVYMDLQDTLNQKIDALKAHASQVTATRVKLDIVEIALATAHFRGVQGRLTSAEAFVPVRLRL